MIRLKSFSIIIIFAYYCKTALQNITAQACLFTTWSGPSTGGLEVPVAARVVYQFIIHAAACISSTGNTFFSKIRVNFEIVIDKVLFYVVSARF